ncbi:unnamed protein product [Rhizoctonia solani]|uniref:Protein kinase domain-containing protein n=1 Tax=Rhizoctonia solani TaxID=456999 RepID=A0A8H2WD16_9AGAM|nr:unnamed protein product [Rhizoctonia solani]
MNQQMTVDVTVQKVAAHSIYKWSKCRHPNIHPLLGFTIFHGRIGMVSQYESNGDVRYYLATNRKSTREQLNLCTEISEGVSYLRKIGIVHGDIKGHNVLISRDGAAMPTDFDNAELSEPSLGSTGTPGLAFSPRWTAPEVILQPTGKTRESDVYSLGMEVVTSKAPWADIQTDMGVVAAVIIRKEIPPGDEHNLIQDVLWNLLVNCWQYDPQARPTSANISKIMKDITETETILVGIIPSPIGISREWEPGPESPGQPGDSTMSEVNSEKDIDPKSSSSDTPYSPPRIIGYFPSESPVLPTHRSSSEFSAPHGGQPELEAPSGISTITLSRYMRGSFWCAPNLLWRISGCLPRKIIRFKHNLREGAESGRRSLTDGNEEAVCISGNSYMEQMQASQHSPVPGFSCVPGQNWNSVTVDAERSLSRVLEEESRR